MATRNVISYGVGVGLGNGTIDRLAAQAAVDAAQDGDDIWWPAGDYVMTYAGGSTTWAVRVMAKRLRLRGDAISLSDVPTGQPGEFESRERYWTFRSRIRMDAAQALDRVNFWLFYVLNVDGFVVEDLEFHGQKPNSGTVTPYGPNQTPPLLREHATGFFLHNVNGFTFRRCYGHDFIGDFNQNYNNVRNLLIEDCVVRWCQRDGVTFSPTDLAQPVDGVIIRRTEISWCSNQQIDNEHGAASNVEIYDFLLRQGIGDPCIAAGGPDLPSNLPADRPPDRVLQSHNWWVHDGVIDGPTYAMWLHDSVFERITGTNNDTDRPIWEVGRSSSGVTIRHCQQSCTQTGLANQSAVYVAGTAGSGPSNIRVEYCDFTMAHPRSFGIRADGCVSIVARGNKLRGAGVAAPGYYGIRVRATSVTRDVEYVCLVQNEIRDFGDGAIGISGNVSGGRRARISHIEAIQNRMENSAPGGPQKVGVLLNDGSAPVRSGLVAGNVSGLGVTTGLVPAQPGSQVAYSFPAISRGAAAQVRELVRAAALRERDRGADLGQPRGLRAEAA